MATVEQDIQNFQASGERNLAELKRVLSEEKKVEEKTQDRLSELANILRKQYSDKPDDDLIVIKETITRGKGEDQQEYTRYRGMTTDEKLQRRKERGEATLLDIWQMGELPTAMRNWRDARNWVKDSDNSTMANMVRHFLGDNSKNIEKRTERIEGRERIEREIERIENTSTSELERLVESDKEITNALKEFEKEFRDASTSDTRKEVVENNKTSETISTNKEVTNSIDKVGKEVVESDKETFDSNERVVNNTVSLLSDIISSNNMDKEAIVKGESASDKENKAEELSLFNKQNAILKGIYDNTIRLLDSTNKLQILKEQTPSPQDNGGILDNIVDLVDLASNGKVFVKGKSIAGKVLKKGKDILGRGISTVAKGASKVGSTVGKVRNNISNTNIKNVGDSIVNKVGSTINKVGDTVTKTNLKNIGGSVVNKFGNVVSNTTPQLKNSFSTIFEGAKNIAQKASTSNIATNTINAMKTNTENLLKMGATYTSPIKEGASTLIQKVGNISVPAPISKGLETVAEGASKVGSTVGKGIGTVAKTASKFGTKGIPIVGTLVGGAMNALEYSAEADAIDKRVASGEITKEEGERQKSKARGEATGATAGSTAGTAIGGAIGALGGPIGIAIGSTLGGLIGEGIGGWLGGWFSEEKPTEELPKVVEKPTEVPKPEKSVHEQFVEHQEKLRSGEIATIVTKGRGRHKREYVKLETTEISKDDYDKRVADEEEVIRKLDMSKSMSDDEIRATAKRHVFTQTDVRPSFDWDKGKLQKIASLDEKNLKEYNEKERIKHEKNGDYVFGAYEDVTVEDIKNAKEALKTFDSKENLQKRYSEKEDYRKHLKDTTERNTVYQTYKDGNVVGKTVVKNGEIVSNFDESKQYGNNIEDFDFKYHENVDRTKFFKDLLNPTTVAKPTETPKVTPKRADEKTIQEKFDEHQAKIKSGEIPKIVKIGKNEYVKLGDGSTLRKRAYDAKVDNEMEVIRKLPMSKNMSEDEIRATANRNVYSNTDTASTLEKEKYKLTEISKLDENSLKAYNDKKREEHRQNTWGGKRTEYKEVTPEDIKNAKEEIKTLESEEHIQEVYSKNEKERKRIKEAAKKAKRNNVNKLNPPPISQTSEVSVVNTADKVNASSNATTINKPSDIGVPPRDDGLVMQNNAEQIKQQEKDASKEMKVEVVNNNVQNINQTNDRRDPMYSRNVDPSYVRTVDERHGIMG